jgi:N-acetylglucosamine-6-sulfatase
MRNSRPGCGFRGRGEGATVRSGSGPVNRRVSGGMLLAGLISLAVALVPSGGEAQKRKKAKQPRPNIVVVMTDDQHADSVRFMPNVQQLLAGRGTTFTNSFVSYSLCCPSRATFLTGQYAHTHGVRTNTPPSGGYSKLAPTLGNSLPAWLQQAGYSTAHVGKFLNGYGNTSPDTEVPAGWTEWYGALDDPDAYTGGTYTMYGYTLNENGNVVHYGSTPDVVDPATYQTDVYSAKAEDFIRRRAPGKKPFFLSVASLASHTEGTGCNCGANNPRAAPRDEGTFAGQPLPKPPNYNEADVSDKPQAIQTLAPIPPTGPMSEAVITARYRAQIESLGAVDDMVGELVGALRETGELKNTVFIFTADNGFFYGEHRVRNGKVRVYEPSVRIPLIIRGPEVPKGKRRSQPVANVDLAPTIVALARARAGRLMDGLSLLPLMEDKRGERGRGLLLETFFNADPEDDPETPPTNYRAVRTDRYLYARYGTGEEELYDLFNDPFELLSRHSDASYATVKSALASLLGKLQNCGGKGCRSKPAVKLKLRKCSRAIVAGKGQPQEAIFYLRGKKIRRDANPPLQAKLPNAESGQRAEAVALTLDGRKVSLERKLRRC